MDSGQFGDPFEGHPLGNTSLVAISQTLPLVGDTEV
jgi:hypothetical protein